MIHRKDVPALINKRMLLAAEIAIAERKLASLRASLETTDSAIVAFVAGRVDRQGGERRQGISRAILDALRQAGPLTKAELVERIAASRGVAVTKELAREIVAALARRKDGLVIRDGERWRIGS